MTDLQKNQAIYQAMCEIAQKYFNQAVDNCEEFKEFMSKKYVITLSELEKCNEWHYGGKNTIIFEKEQITVDTFHCKFLGSNVFDLMRSFKSLAKVKGDYLFTYEEDIPNEFIGSVDITLASPANAKLLVNSAANDRFRHVMNNVLVEVNATSGNINFVATDGHEIGIISNNPEAICSPHGENSRMFQALFTQDDWKRICDYEKETKSAVTFKIYERAADEFGVMEAADTMVADLGGIKVKSVQQGHFPNWKAVLPNPSTMQSFHIHPDDVKAAQAFIKSFKGKDKEKPIYVSFYRGSDLIYFDYHDAEYDKDRAAAFRLTQPSAVTIGVGYVVRRLQSKKFTGFSLMGEKVMGEKCYTYVNDERTDLTLQMSLYREDGIYTCDEEHREVVSQKVCLAVPHAVVA